MIRINDIIEKMVQNYPDADVDIVDRAYIYSARVHAGQVRLSGEPYLSHPLEVAYILANMKLDSVSVASGLLHDVVEDTHATEDDIRQMFGDEVLNIVAGVTKLTSIEAHSSQARQAESIRKMLLAMASDIRVVLIKLADRLHNMKTLQYHKNPEKRAAIAQETLDIYTPIAARLGIYWIKQELEDIAFQYVLPDEYEKIKALINKDQEERTEYIESIKSYIEHKMSEADLKCEVMGRYKQYYSIYQKMVSQSLEFEDVYDIIAFRVILGSEDCCYKALGMIHNLWKPIAIKFKDYIGTPKANMYQSLHTTVIGFMGERIEIQLRTHEMDQVAKSGIAAHWSYKEGKNISEKTGQTYAWIQNIVENQENVRNPDEFMENVRIDLFPDEIYVFTPTGEIKSMPKGATTVDFAFMIHTEVGNQCVGAKINNRMVPIHTELKTGDIVQIVTSKSQHPSKDWLNFVKTVKARSRIRQWIKIQERGKSVALGKEMCEKEFRKHRLAFSQFMKSKEMDNIVSDLGYKSVDDLIANVGYGKITPLQVLGKHLPKSQQKAAKIKEDESILNKLMGKMRRKKPATGIVVKGMDDILIRFGKCCQPLPGDSITGYITLGYGVTIHRASCVNALKMSPERQIEVSWNKSANATYPVKIRVRSQDRFGLLADIAANISKSGANILNANTETLENKTVYGYFTIAVEDTFHLKKVINSIKRIKHVHEVRRIDD